MMFSAARFAVKMGDRLDLDALTAFLTRNGYARTATVMEPGEYAVRGGIVDIFPPGNDEPVRLDLFGDEVDGISRFDALTPRTTVPRQGIAIMPHTDRHPDAAANPRVPPRYPDLFLTPTGQGPP